MKASEVTEDGYYWAKACGKWHVVAASDGYFHYGDGSLEPMSKLEHDYDVVGPIKPPCDDDEPMEEACARFDGYD